MVNNKGFFCAVKLVDCYEETLVETWVKYALMASRRLLALMWCGVKSALSRLALKCRCHRTRPIEQWLMTKDFFVHLNLLAVMRGPWWERE